MPVTTVSLDSEVAQASVWLDHRLLTISKAIKELLLLARLASLPQKSRGFGGTALSGSATTIQEPGVVTLSSTIEKYNIILRQSWAKGNTQKNKEIPTIIQQISLWESRPVRLLQKRRGLNKSQRFCSSSFKLNFSFSCFCHESSLPSLFHSLFFVKSMCSLFLSVWLVALAPEVTDLFSSCQTNNAKTITPQTPQTAKEKHPDANRKGNPESQKEAKRKPSSPWELFKVVTSKTL